MSNHLCADHSKSNGNETTMLIFSVLAARVSVFREKPPIPPSFAQLAAVEALAKEKYVDSLRRLITNVGFVTLLITYGGFQPVPVGAVLVLSNNPIFVWVFKFTVQSEWKENL